MKKEKRWIVDIDSKDENYLNSVIKIIQNCRPEEVHKIEMVIPTKNGHHIITKRFDIQEFNKHYPEINIHKKNPTLLYFPNSLENNL